MFYPLPLNTAVVQYYFRFEATVDTPETKSKRTQKTSRRPDQSIKVNFDDRTDRTATQIDFRHVGTKIADMKTTMKLN